MGGNREGVQVEVRIINEVNAIFFFGINEKKKQQKR